METNKATMTKDTYLAKFRTVSDAVEFEEQALSVGDEFLPAEARNVRDEGGPGSPVYWAWLCAQVDQAADR